ncbi:Chromate resistance protein ChrB [Couchioplanes caeruleus]|uniref:Chromate resistance protein ChrB n=1 Tax=Couchioplanes caeruleus TaxID=56438 RepID=UPI0020102B63|nr:Chromate resistance protein ChrB [Couchioplanes caeruleus]
MLLAYRMPREPSSPRIAVWRKLERLGVARLGDGLVALPADARTREQFDRIAEEIGEAHGSATVWLAEPATLAQEREIAAAMREARAAEYRAVIDEATTTSAAGSPAERARVVRRLRNELRRIARRDFFPPRERDAARTTVQSLADDNAPSQMAEQEQS